MNHLFGSAHPNLLDPSTLIGALVWGVIFTVIATIMAAGIRRFARRVGEHLSDVTGLEFASSLAQVLAYVIAFILYAHLVPELRELGTGLLAGVGLVSVVLGFAAQSTLGNLFAGLLLVLYRPVRVGDNIQLTTPKGLTAAMVERISLGYTVLRDTDRNEIIVPNSVMASSVVLRLGASRDLPD